MHVISTPDKSRQQVGPISEHAVVVAGGGPTGLMLAGELALAGVDVAIVERRASQDLIGSRAGGLHSRTIEVLDQRGIADRFLSQGQVAQVAGFSQIRLDISDFPTRHPYGLALWQNHIERILADWVAELSVPIYRGRAVTGIAQDRIGVDVELAGGQLLRAEYVVGCDGGRSLIRKAAGIEFPGWDPTMSYLIAEVEMAVETGVAPQWGIRHDAVGVHSLSMLEDGGPARVMVTERHLGPAGEPTLRDLSEALIGVYGTDYGIHSPTWISRSTDMARQAADYRDRRVLLAGDAAHVHHPVGGQGLNTGVQDAVNLGWKLAQVVNQTSPDGLLDTYHAERHPVAARVLRNTMAQMALLRPDDRTKALRDNVSELLGMDEPRKRFAAMMSGLDIHYDLGDGHPLLGRRMPDLDLVTATGPLRVFTLLHDARPVLLNLGEPNGVDIAPWADRVQLVDAKYVGDWELPVLGAVTAPTAVLIRPDGYVAWVGDRPHPGLADALTTWFGPPTAGETNRTAIHSLQAMSSAPDPRILTDDNTYIDREQFNRERSVGGVVQSEVAVTRVAVIGAGIGGLAAALALRSRDIDAVVLEQAGRLDPVGAGIQLSPNANQVLARLGVLDAVVNAAFEPRTMDVLAGRRRRTMLSAPVRAWAHDRYERPYLNVHRGDLHAALLDAVREVLPGGLQLDSRVTSVTQGDDGVRVRLHDSRIVDADVVIGADGVHSAVRSHVVPADQPARFTGHVAYRMLVPRAALPAAQVPGPAVTLWMPPHGHIVSYWVRRGELYNTVAIIEDDSWREDGWNIKADLSAVRAAFSDWAPRLHAWFDAAGDIHKWALLDHRVPPLWSRGRVALLGDSCHAMLPYLAQGGAMAIEDAWVLASVLAHTADPVAALARYSQLRVDRVSRLHSGALRNAKTFHSTGHRALLRDAGLRVLSSRPNRFLDRMDWVYGHDVTALIA